MKKYLTLIVEKQASGMTVEKFLCIYLGLTKKQISRAKFRNDGICKNKIQCRVTEKVSEGDEVRVCLEADDTHSKQLVYIKEQTDLKVIYEDEDVLAVNKPAGILTHPSGVHYDDSLSNQVAAYFQKKDLLVSVRPVGRLDKETSGIVLFAKNRVAAQRLQEQRMNGMLEKQYLAIAEGKLPIDMKDEWHLINFPIRKIGDHPLRMEAVKSRNDSTKILCDNSADNSKCMNAVTHYRVLDSTDKWSVINLKLDTGRTHQIRVHMQAIGHPLIGDTLYNDFTNRKESFPVYRAALHAWKVCFYQPFTKRLITLEAPVPEELQQFTKRLTAK